MGLDVYYYKMKTRKSEELVEQEIEKLEGIGNFIESNVEMCPSETGIQKSIYGYTMPKRYAYGRKIWETLSNFSRSNNIERGWDVLDRCHIEEMRNLSLDVYNDIPDNKYSKEYYNEQYHMFSAMLNLIKDEDQIFVVYSY